MWTGVTIGNHFGSFIEYVYSEVVGFYANDILADLAQAKQIVL